MKPNDILWGIVIAAIVVIGGIVIVFGVSNLPEPEPVIETGYELVITSTNNDLVTLRVYGLGYAIVDMPYSKNVTIFSNDRDSWNCVFYFTEDVLSNGIYIDNVKSERYRVNYASLKANNMRAFIELVNQNVTITFTIRYVISSIVPLVSSGVGTGVLGCTIYVREIMGVIF